MKTTEFIRAYPRIKIPRSNIDRLVKRIMKTERNAPSDYSLSFVFVNDALIKKINKQFLHHPYTTDVISFTLSEPGARILEGEIYINRDQALRQANDYNVTLINETLRLAVHGLLHIIGYNDNTVKKRAAMLNRGEYYLRMVP
jgi:probable rRNA maturation factor